jgi:hypothetical protein
MLFTYGAYVGQPMSVAVQPFPDAQAIRADPERRGDGGHIGKAGTARTDAAASAIAAPMANPATTALTSAG